VFLKKKKKNKFPCTSRQARKFDPFSIMHKNFHRSYRQGNWGVTVGSRVNHIRAQRTLAGLEAQKTLQAQHLRGRKTGDSNSRPTRPPGLRLSNSRLPVRDFLRRQWTRIRDLQDLRVLGSRIRGSLFETFSDDNGLEFVASET
jgi:hypothetical protein